jgi:predicted phosphohydrolase
MSIWAVADIHASRIDLSTGKPSKPMDIFGDHWEDHVSRMERAWDECVEQGDTVIVAGDIDWALHLEDAMDTLLRLDSWNGRKILVRGNHDYWWSSKTTNRVRRVLPPSIKILHNNALQVEEFNICGTKGCPVPGAIDWTEQNAKLLNREEQRLALSLAQRDPSFPTVVAIHYPPFYPSGGPNSLVEILKAADARCVVYGHLHGQAAASGPKGCFDGIDYRLVAADAVDFRPVLIAADGRLAEQCA